MTQKTQTVLDRIVADKREELAAAKRAVPLAAMKARVDEAPAVRPFPPALRGPSIGVIAEVKKASPSRGLLRDGFDAVWLAQRYAEGGACAVSVLTDAKQFQGSLRDLSAVREALPAGPPLLRKDFLFDAYQLYEARCHGADAVLLITAILEQPLLAELISIAQALGMTALVEVHDAAEMERALAASPPLIGINNRDLRTFDVDLAITERLRPLAPPQLPVIAESGIFTREGLRRLQACNVQAALIGEALVTAPDPAAKLRELLA